VIGFQLVNDNMASKPNYLDHLKDDSLEFFLEAMADFNQLFCDSMAKNKDYTLKLEVRGDKGRVLHIRVQSDGFKRPANGEIKDHSSEGL
jgi:hypothetical protein